MDRLGRKPPRPGVVTHPVPQKPVWNREGHPSEDFLEEYAFGRLQEPDTAPVEEHLMLCENCRDSLVRVEAFIQELKSGILIYRKEHPKLAPIQPVAVRRQPAGWRQNLTWGATVAAVVLAILVWPPPAGQTVAPAPIALASFRGGPAGGKSPSDTIMARGPAGRPLELALDATGIPNGVRCRVEVVTMSGERAWNGASTPEDGKLMAHLPQGLRSGSYWVRLYASGDELVREFGLRLD